MYTTCKTVVINAPFFLQQLENLIYLNYSFNKEVFGMFVHATPNRNSLVNMHGNILKSVVCYKFKFQNDEN